jgi:hypothetical protein
MQKFHIEKIDFLYSSIEELSVMSIAIDLLRKRLSIIAGQNIEVDASFIHVNDIDPLQNSNQAIVVHSLMFLIQKNHQELENFEKKWGLNKLDSEATRLGKHYFLTIFQYLLTASGITSNAVNEMSIKHIRDINLLAFKMSHLYKYLIIDLDLVFTQLGALSTETDYSLKGDFAKLIAADFICTTLMLDNLNIFLGENFENRAHLVFGGIKGFYNRSLKLLTTRMRTEDPTNCQRM